LAKLQVTSRIGQPSIANVTRTFYNGGRREYGQLTPGFLVSRMLLWTLSQLVAFFASGLPIWKLRKSPIASSHGRCKPPPHHSRISHCIRPSCFLVGCSGFFWGNKNDIKLQSRLHMAGVLIFRIGVKPGGRLESPGGWKHYVTFKSRVSVFLYYTFAVGILTLLRKC
jgi:hypothetical protein